MWRRERTTAAEEKREEAESEVVGVEDESQILSDVVRRHGLYSGCGCEGAHALLREEGAGRSRQG